MPRRSNEQIITDLIEAGATTLRQAHEHNVALTEAYKTLAGIIVDLRKRFQNSKDTAPDWRGQTQAYRDAVAKMYEQSGVPADSVSNMQAAIRYHVGNVLRERLSAEELAQAGLKAEGPLERSRSNNARSDAGGGLGDPEWFEDTITSLKSIEDEHPEVVVIDLREDEVDVLPMCHKALTVIQTAHAAGVTVENRDAVGAVLDQMLAETAAFRADVQAFEMPERTTTTRGRSARAPANA